LNPFVSIVIPAHNEQNRLPGTLEQIFHFLEQQTFTSEVIVVENGSTDQTYELANSLQSSMQICVCFRAAKEKVRLFNTGC